MPGIHHVMARSIKDIFCRYKTLKGFQVKRKGGWDTHGLPIELAVEKTLGITKEDIGKTITVEEYNDYCRKEVMKYTDVWNDLTEKMGYWVALKNPYITYEDRKSVVKGKRVSVRVDIGGRCIIKKNKTIGHLLVSTRKKIN